MEEVPVKDVSGAGDTFIVSGKAEAGGYGSPGVSSARGDAHYSNG